MNEKQKTALRGWIAGANLTLGFYAIITLPFAINYFGIFVNLPLGIYLTYKVFTK